MSVDTIRHSMGEAHIGLGTKFAWIIQIPSRVHPKRLPCGLRKFADYFLTLIFRHAKDSLGFSDHVPSELRGSVLEPRKTKLLESRSRQFSNCGPWLDIDTCADGSNRGSRSAKSSKPACRLRIANRFGHRRPAGVSRAHEDQHALRQVEAQARSLSRLESRRHRQESNRHANDRGR